MAVDVTAADDVSAAVDRAVQLHGRLDAVVLTSAVMAYGTVEDVPAEVFEHVVDVAVTGTANVARAVLSRVPPAGAGAC